MSSCTRCSGPLDSSHKFCPSCGAPVTDSSALPTAAAPSPTSGRRSSANSGKAGSETGRAARLSSQVTSQEGRFAPGTVLVERYQIIGLLGKGGMGDVYRADDLKLGLPVALKFLSRPFASDPDRLGRFYNEVRIAREISHPSVCRVHDIGDVEGQPFLSMEYVDGEDLSSLLRRIGRLPTDKATEIARQICAGLAAAHDKGVLHRDLKPANIMIDGRGRARITDFGLAGLSQDIHGAEVRSGTPAYMAPEQLAGKEVTEQSDIYALGLVLYELFTGRRVFEGKSLAELTHLHLDQEPIKPTALVPDLDPAIERVILRCLEKSPEAIPQSPLSVAAALPGGDPLAAALAAGETPSPEMVAAAGEQGELRPAVAGAALAFSIIGMLLAVALTMGTQISHLVPFEKTPPALEDRGFELLEHIGVEEASDGALGLVADMDYIQHVAANDYSPDRWSHLASGRPPAVQFWYRQSPRALVSSSFSGRVSPSDPGIRLSGMAGVNLDMQGRLVELYAVPPQVEEVSPSVSPPDWTELLVRAGLEETELTPVEPKWTPPFFCDERVAWEGVYPDAPAIPILVEAAAYQGRPVYFRVIHEWTRPERMERFQLSPQRDAANRISGFPLGVDPRRGCSSGAAEPASRTWGPARGVPPDNVHPLGLHDRLAPPSTSCRELWRRARCLWERCGECSTPVHFPMDDVYRARALCPSALARRTHRMESPSWRRFS